VRRLTTADANVSVAQVDPARLTALNVNLKRAPGEFSEPAICVRVPFIVTAMALHLHRAERTDLLADGLGTLLADPLPDSFAEELVLVPEHGIERWLSQRLSHILGVSHGSDGVCAGVAFRRPGSLIAQITDTVDHDPWAAETMAWPLLEVIDQSLDEPWCRTLATHLGHFEKTETEAELRRGRRYSVARRLAGLFASYARQRPQLLIDWLGDQTNNLDSDLAWQPRLWGALVERVDAEPPHIRQQKTVARLREEPTDLPRRLSMFGHTRLPAADIELLQALATHHDVHLWLPHPSDELWQALAGTHGSIPRSQDESRRAADHPLLDTLARDLRELQRSLAVSPATDEYINAAAEERQTLLAWLQSDIASNHIRSHGRVLGEGDLSVQVHSCHGPTRQIDVLREVLLGLLADDPTLEPRDILVMCPDIETYAPLIVADFGLGEVAGDTHPAHRLRVKLADRALTQTNALLGVATELLTVAGSRVTANQILNLAQAPPVRARFGFTDDHLDTITDWVRDSNIRWGFDADHRRPYGLDQFKHNTWRFGLDRILTGVAMSDDSQAYLDTALPLDDVGSDRIELAGRLAEFVARLQSAFDALSEMRPLSEWVGALRQSVAELTWFGPGEKWQDAELQRELSKVLFQSGSRSDTKLRLADMRSLLSGHLAGRPTRANFRTGTLTVCTMVPMRSVPHKVICLVGLDDGVFPRVDSADGDNALARCPMTGERDIRSEDRQLLLDAVCAATETLVITYTGADEYTGQPRPAAVPLAELLDSLDETTESPVREAIVTHHPLQPFDRRNVTPGALGVPGKPFTFDPTALPAAEAAAGRRTEPSQFFSTFLPPSSGDVELADLLTFFKHPVRGFFKALDYTLPWDVDRVKDAIPVKLSGLEQWAVGDRMVANMLRGMHPEDAAHTEWRRGELPPGRIGVRLASDIRDMARKIAEAAIEHRQAHPASYDLDIDLGGGRRLTGTVSPVFGARTVSATYSNLAAKHLLQAWIALVALTAQRPESDWTALCIGRHKNSPNRVAMRLFQSPRKPLDVMKSLVALYDAGRCEPLPLPLKTSFAWAEARRDGDDPVNAAQDSWRSTDFRDAENSEEAYDTVWGWRAPLETILGEPRTGEEFSGEGTRLGALAMRLWSPLLADERSAW
jgi:exodeoxyribonuclease V gamma subunit